MSTTTTFDTLAFEKKLEKAGFEGKQAEALTKAIADIVSEDKVVSRQYLDLRLAELKHDLVKWVLGLLLAQAAIIISCLKFIH
jgi:hypothetical protein